VAARLATGAVLGIETSCDETAVAIVAGDRVLGAEVASQVPDHARFGGVVPEVAARNHLLAILPTVESALRAAHLQPADLTGVAVTHRPGLAGALLVGVHTARALAWAWGVPIVGVDHVAAHVWACHLHDGGAPALRPPALPFAALAVSGGHTSLLRVDGPEHMTVLGRTLDDAAGEAFDKVAKLIGLPYPGGPSVEREAARGDPARVRLPRGMVGRDDDSYSFSGLKTAVRLQVDAARKAGALEASVADLCAAFQAAVVDQLVRVTLRALARHGLRRLVLAGGVAANGSLRSALAAACAGRRIAFHPVPLPYCGDNGAMVAALGAALLATGRADAVFDLDIVDSVAARRGARAEAS